MKKTHYDEISIALHAGAKEVKKLKCPNCGSGVRIAYYASDTVRGMRCECKQCDFIMRLCGVKEQPPWVAALGNEIET